MQSKIHTMITKAFSLRMTDASRASNYVDFMGGLDYEIKPGYQGNQELISVLDDYERQFDRGRISADEYIQTISSLRDAVDIKKPSFDR